MIPFDRTLIAAVVIALTTSACGGGGGGSSSTAPAPIGGGSGDNTGGGTDGGTDNGDTTDDGDDAAATAKDVAFGTITQFGSIFVNGVKYDTSTATIIIDGAEATEDDLGVGMVVFVQGTVNEDGVTGVAEVVIVDDNLKGPIRYVTPATDDAGNPLDARQITVLGIDVIIERTGTVFEDTTFETIAEGDFVEVYGFTEAGNNVRATRIHSKPFFTNRTQIEVYGKPSAIDTALKTFALGEYLVDYSEADVSDLSGGDPLEGVLLEVKGTLPAPDALNIKATKVEPARFETGGAVDGDIDPSTAAAEQMSVEGTITGLSLENLTFKVNGFSVDASMAVLEPASLQLANGLVIQAKGPYDGDVLVAEQIEGRRGRVEVEGLVNAIDSAEKIITIDLGGGQFISVGVDNGTLIDDDRSSKNDRLAFDDIKTGYYLEIEAKYVNNDRYVATRIDLEDRDDGEREVQAPLDRFDPGFSVTLLEITFTVDSRTEYEDADGRDITADTFFSTAELGDLVKVEDDDGDGVADEIELEISDKLDGSEFDDSDDSSDDSDDSLEDSDDSSDDSDDSSDDSDDSSTDSDDSEDDSDDSSDDSADSSDDSADSSDDSDDSSDDSDDSPDDSDDSSDDSDDSSDDSDDSSDDSVDSPDDSDDSSDDSDDSSDDSVDD